jgi:hypothetical protein
MQTPVGYATGRCLQISVSTSLENPAKCFEHDWEVPLR